MKNHYIIIYFIMFIIIYIIRSKVNNGRVKKCHWKSISVSYDKKRINICQKYIKIINSLGVYYFISFGSQLGAVRNEGLINSDVDIDVIIPISKNRYIFKCSEEIKIVDNHYDDKYVLMDNRILLCNKTRKYYSKLFYNYILKQFNKYNIIKSTYSDLVIGIYISKELYIDFYITIANEWIYRDYNLCMCKFCDMQAFCQFNSYNLTKLIYGNSFLTPIKNKKSHLSPIRLKKSISTYKYFYV